MEKNFVFIEEMSIFKKISFSVIFGLGLFILLSGGLILGFILLGIALYFLMQDGVELNLLDMKYRELTSWYGIKFGKWKSLPDIEYVSVFETIKTSRFRAAGGNADHTSSIIFKLNLFYKRNKHITLLSTENKNKALEIGDNISKILDVRLNNAAK